MGVCAGLSLKKLQPAPNAETSLRGTAAQKVTADDMTLEPWQRQRTAAPVDRGRVGARDKVSGASSKRATQSSRGGRGHPFARSNYEAPLQNGANCFHPLGADDAVWLLFCSLA